MTQQSAESPPAGRTPLWSHEDLCDALGLPATEGPAASGVTLDSRTLVPGDLFVALPGRDPRYRGAGDSDRDGHDFVGAAKAAGASAALVSRRLDVDLPQLVVDDTYAGLLALARAARARFAGPVIAITGSSGKTTAKTLLARAWAGAFAAEGSFNNHLGVPLTLARLPRDASAAIIEIGMNTPGEIAPMSRLARPDVALVLNVLPVHLEGLGSLEAIRQEKLSIAAGLTSDGVLVAPEGLQVDAVPGRLLRFGSGDAAEVQGRLQDGHLELRLPDGSRLTVPGPIRGEHRLQTLTAVIACIHAAGGDPATAATRLADPELPAGRGRRTVSGGVTLIDDSYNANPVSTAHALRGLAEEAPRRWALLGDMLELGPEELRMHAGLAGACDDLDGVFCVGERMRALHDALPPQQRAGWWPDVASLDLQRVVEVLAPGDTLLVKGSNRLFWKHGTVPALEALLAGTG